MRFFYFLAKDLCRACSEVSETGLGSKIGQRQPENEWDALRPLNANPAVDKKDITIPGLEVDLIREDISKNSEMVSWDE